VLKEIRTSRKSELIAAARRNPTCAGSIEFPAWYLQRWHFLPEGYFSARSVRLYEFVIGRVYNVGMEQPILDRLTAEVLRERPSTVVELGCGPGNALRALSRDPSARLAGVDLSPFMVETARTHNPAAELFHADARNCPLEEGTADVVVTMHVLGHVPHEVADEIVVEAARLTGPGGRLITVDHSWHRLPEMAGGLKKEGSRKLLGGLLTMSVFRRIRE
jgi:SAM-dependent methyltransferase